jgi:hypothetical protein
MPDSGDKQPTYRVIGVCADGSRVTVVRAMLKETAETIARMLMIEHVYKRMEIERE